MLAAIGARKVPEDGKIQAADPLSATVEDFMGATTLSPLERTEVDNER